MIRATRQRVAHIANDAMYAPPPDEVIYGAEQGARRRAKELTDALSDEQRRKGCWYDVRKEAPLFVRHWRRGGSGRGDSHGR